MNSFSKHGTAALLESLLFFTVVAALFLAALWYSDAQPTDNLYIRDWNKSATYLDRVLETREITLIARNAPQSYYLYREQAMGFEYDLAKAFADFLGARLDVQVGDTWQEMLSMLEETPTGFIATGGLAPPSPAGPVVFADGYLTSSLHIIVHRENRHIQHPGHLAGKSVHITNGSPYQASLDALRAQGIDLELVLHVDVPTEELISRVAEKTIDITIADSHTAILNRRYYPQIIVADAISDETEMGWAVDAKADGLLAQANLFLQVVKDNGDFKEIYDRYFTDPDNFDFVDLRAYHRRLRSRLPKYQALIQEAADTHGFDWRLIAAQIYQESHFDPRATSHAGAYGLMQLTQATAAQFHISDLFDPEANIQAGVRHLKYLYDHFDDVEGPDRIYLVLAAYNTGQGHLLDARRLAERQRLDPDKWSSISETLPMLSYPKYYRQATYGYCRGTETVAYVKQVMLYYDILKYQGMPWVSAG